MTTLTRVRVVPAYAVAVLSLGAAIAASADRQTVSQQPTEMRSTQSGVYTAEQATRGEATFTSICTGCHTTATYATPAFAKKWNGRPVGELFTVIAETMPEDFPGTLTPAEYAQVVAYLLKLNRMPAGAEDLPADADALNKIRFDIAGLIHH